MQQHESYETCPYCHDTVSTMACKCGMLQILRGECIISEGVTVVHKYGGEHERKRKRRKT